MALLYLLFGISSFLIIICIMNLDKRLNKLDERLGKYEKKEKNKNSEIIDI